MSAENKFGKISKLNEDIMECKCIVRPNEEIKECKCIVKPVNQIIVCKCGRHNQGGELIDAIGYVPERQGALIYRKPRSSKQNEKKNKCNIL